MDETNVVKKIEEISSVKKSLLFDVPWGDVKKELDSAYMDVSKTAKIKGFRPGKTPRKVLEIYYKDQAEDRAISNLVNRFYWKALEENTIVPVTEPVIDQNGIKIDKNFEFTATVEVKPVIEPKDYIGLELEKEEPEIKDEDVHARHEDIRHMYATVKDIESNRGIIEGDFVYIDFKGKLDGRAIKGLSQENYLLEVGSKGFVPGFEEQIIGLIKGESKEVTVKIPEDYHSREIAGKDISFSVTVKDIKEKVLPELDEDFVKNFEKYKTLDELKQDVRKSVEEENKARIDTEFKNCIIDKLLEKNDFEVPPSFVENQIFSMMFDVQRRMTFGGMSPENAAEVSLKLHDKFKDEAEKTVKTVFLIDSIARKESITVSEEDVEEKLRDFAGKYAQDYDLFKKSYEEGNKIEPLKMRILEEKTLDFIEGKAKISFVKKTGGKLDGSDSDGD